MTKTETAPAGTPKKSGRLLALDILRGITIAGMLMVNNPGSWSNIYAPLAHAEWNGLTPTDLVFPFFMFIMGISTYFSLKKYNFEFNRQSFTKLLRRTVVLFAIGLGIAWFGMFLRGILNEKTFAEAVFTFDHIRILGVIPRLAICYGVGATLALLVPHNKLPWLVALFLILYSIILIFGRGYEQSSNNIIAIVDTAVLGENHMYTSYFFGERVKFDPEGLLSTLPSIAHMLIGFICGMLIMRTRDNEKRINTLFIIGTILTFAGFLLSYGLPINKKVWSPTFVLTTCGLASSFLGLLIWIIDIKGHNKWCRFFEAFGINPLFLYCFGTLMAIVIGAVKIPVGGEMMSIHSFFYKECFMPLCAGHAHLASFLFAVSFVLINWCIGYILYKKKIYIKI